MLQNGKLYSKISKSGYLTEDSKKKKREEKMTMLITAYYHMAIKRNIIQQLEIPCHFGKDKNMDYSVLENFNVKLCSKKQNTNCHVTQSVQFSRSVVSDSLWPHGLQHAWLPCPSPTPRACSNSCPSSQWCHLTTSSSVIPSSLAFNLSQHQGLFQWASSSDQVATVLECQLQHHSVQWIFRTDFL